MSDLYTRVCAGVLFPLHERINGRRSVAMLRELGATQWLDAQQLAALQLRRLRDLLQTAGAQVPYYRDTFARLAFEPANLESLADLARLPVLDEDTIRAEGVRMGTALAAKLPWRHAAESADRPLPFKAGIMRRSADIAARWRARRWWGVEIGDREMVCRRKPVAVHGRERGRIWRAAALRSTVVHIGAATPARLDELVARIRAGRPQALYGHTSLLALVAQHVLLRGTDLARHGIKVAFATAGQLPATQRIAITRAFGCPVAGGYERSDTGFIAHECPHGGLHVNAEGLIVEIVDEQGRALPPGQPGRVLVTHLHSHDFPFVRYDSGDVAVLEDETCVCGRNLPLLRVVRRTGAPGCEVTEETRAQQGARPAAHGAGPLVSEG